MDPRDFFALISRHRVFVALGLLLGVLLGAGYTSLFDKGYRSATIFITMGMTMPVNAPAVQYVTNESHNIIDQFTETVQGWLRDPALQRDLDERAGANVSLSARKQEKQNLLVELRVPVILNVQDSAMAFLGLLNDEIIRYNSNTQSRFVLAKTSVTADERLPRYGLNVLTGALLGVLLAVVMAVMLEFFKRRVSFGFQVEHVFGKVPLLRLPSLFKTDALQGFIHLFAGRSSASILLLEVGQTSMGHHRAVFEKFPALHFCRYPDGLTSAGTKGARVVVVVQLGISSEDLIAELRFLHGDSLDFILIV